MRWCVQKYFQNHYRNQMIKMHNYSITELQISKISTLLSFLKGGHPQDRWMATWLPMPQLGFYLLYFSGVSLHFQQQGNNYWFSQILYVKLLQRKKSYTNSFPQMGETHSCRKSKKPSFTKPFEMDETEWLIIYSEQLVFELVIIQNYDDVLFALVSINTFCTGVTLELNWCHR